MVLPSRSGASHGCDCILCAVPALSSLASSVLFSNSLREERGITTLLRHNETGDGLILRQRREMDAFDAYDGHQHSSASLPLLVTTRQGSPLMAMAIWHWRQHVRMPRTDAQYFSDLPTARAGKADGREVQAKRRSKWYAGT